MLVQVAGNAASLQLDIEITPTLGFQIWFSFRSAGIADFTPGTIQVWFRIFQEVCSARDTFTADMFGNKTLLSGFLALKSSDPIPSTSQIPGVALIFDILLNVPDAYRPIIFLVHALSRGSPPMSVTHTQHWFLKLDRELSKLSKQQPQPVPGSDDAQARINYLEEQMDRIVYAQEPSPSPHPPLTPGSHRIVLLRTAVLALKLSSLASSFNTQFPSAVFAKSALYHTLMSVGVDLCEHNSAQHDRQIQPGKAASKDGKEPGSKRHAANQSAQSAQSNDHKGVSKAEQANAAEQEERQLSLTVVNLVMPLFMEKNQLNAMGMDLQVTMCIHVLKGVMVMVQPSLYQAVAAEMVAWSQ